MPLGNGYFIPAAWIIWLLFALLILLAALYVQLLHWESQFQANRASWLLQIRLFARQARQLRGSTSRLPEFDPLNWLQPLFRGVGVFAFRLLKWFLLTRFARP